MMPADSYGGKIVKKNSVPVFVFFIVFALGVQTAWAQLNIPNIQDFIKDKLEQPRQKPSTPSESRPSESRPADSQATPSRRAEPLTMNDPHYQALGSLTGNIGLYQDEHTKAWKVADGFADLEGAKCMKTLDELAAAGVPASRTLEVRYDTPEFKRGVRSLAEIRKSCEHVERLGKMRPFERWAQQAKADAPRLAAGRPEMAYYTRCLEAYGEMIKAGIAPTERVPEQKLASGLWSGTVEEIRQQWCDAGLKQAKGQTADREGPYRSVLKGDKLKMVIGSPPGHIRTYAVPGGEYTTDAKKLAAASVWFDNASAPSNERQTCPTGGKQINLHRYTFDAQHTMVSNTSREYCGDIPTSAYR